jgi:hypothetical protein
MEMADLSTRLRERAISVFPGGTIGGIQNMSEMRREFLISSLRTQFNKLGGLIDTLQKGGKVDYVYSEASLKELESGLRQLRKVCLSC